jgi:glycosyltransferase involved in cell wall biosynthesis
MPEKRIKVWMGIGSLSGGGAEKQLELLVNALDPDRFEIRVAYVRERDVTPEYPASVTKRFLNRTSIYRWDSIWHATWQDLKKWRPDVIHVWLPEVISIPGSFCGRLLGIPVVTSIRRSNYKGIGWRNYLRETLGLLPHLCSNQIVSNFPLLGEIEPLRSFWRWGHAMVIPNGVRLADAGLDSSRERSEAEVKAVHFVFVGRFAPQKRLPFLIRAMSGVKNLEWTLTVFGTGSALDQEALEALVEAEQLKGRIRFEGFVPDWRKESARFDYMLFPSVSEGMPNVVVEAMAEGLPVVGSQITELSNILTDGHNGVYFEPDDAESLQAAIRNLPQSRATYLAWSEHAVATADRFSIAALVEAYSQLYTRMGIHPKS